MDRYQLLREAIKDDPPFIIGELEDPLMQAMEKEGLIAYYDGVFWLTYDGEAVAKGELC